MRMIGCLGKASKRVISARFSSGKELLFGGINSDIYLLTRSDEKLRDEFFC